MSAVVDKAGQIVIPREVREKLELGPGSIVDFNVDDQGRAYLWKTQDAAERLAVLEKMVGTLNLGMTTDEFMAVMRGED